ASARQRVDQTLRLTALPGVSLLENLLENASGPVRIAHIDIGAREVELRADLGHRVRIERAEILGAGRIVAADRLVADIELDRRRAAVLEELALDRRPRLLDRIAAGERGGKGVEIEIETGIRRSRLGRVAFERVQERRIAREPAVALEPRGPNSSSIGASIVASRSPSTAVPISSIASSSATSVMPDAASRSSSSFGCSRVSPSPRSASGSVPRSSGSPDRSSTVRPRSSRSISSVYSLGDECMSVCSRLGIAVVSPLGARRSSVLPLSDPSAGVSTVGASLSLGHGDWACTHGD